MSRGTERGGHPQRDAQGRLTSLAGLVGLVLAGLVTAAAVLLLIEAVLVAAAGGRFGSANGWLIVILPVWLFVEEFRAWRGTPGRIVAALVATGVGVAAGALAAGLAAGVGDRPLPTVTGAVGAVVAVLGYAVVWFHGIRWLAGRAGPR